MLKSKKILITLLLLIVILLIPCIVNATVEYTRSFPGNDGTIEINLTGLQLDENKQYDENYAVTNNYWAGAKKACADMGMSLPTRTQLAQLVSNLYVDSNGNTVTIGISEYKWGLKIKDEYKSNPPLTLGGSYWSSEDGGGLYHAFYRAFDSTSTASGGASGDGSGIKDEGYYRAICISN